MHLFWYQLEMYSMWKSVWVCTWFRLLENQGTNRAMVWNCSHISHVGHNMFNAVYIYEGTQKQLEHLRRDINDPDLLWAPGVTYHVLVCQSVVGSGVGQGCVHMYILYCFFPLVWTLVGNWNIRSELEQRAEDFSLSTLSHWVPDFKKAA